MKRTVVAAAIVLFVVAGVTWALAAHHAVGVPSLGPVNQVGTVVSDISKHIPKDLPRVGKCLQGGDPSHIAKCVGKRLPRIPGLSGFSSSLQQAGSA